MKCDRIQACLEQWVDEEIPPRLQRRIEAHLAACPACRQQAQAYRELVAELEQARAEFDVASPARFTQAVLERARTAGPPRSARPLGLQWALVGGLAATLALLALVCLRGLGGLPSPLPRLAQGGRVPQQDRSRPVPLETREPANRTAEKREPAPPSSGQRPASQADGASPGKKAASRPHYHRTPSPQRPSLSPRLRGRVRPDSGRMKTGPTGPLAPPDGAPVTPEPGTNKETGPDFWLVATEGADGETFLAAVHPVQQREMVQIEAELADHQKEIERRQRETELAWRMTRQREELYPSHADDPVGSGFGQCDQLLADLGHASSL